MRCLPRRLCGCKWNAIRMIACGSSCAFLDVTVSLTEVSMVENDVGIVTLSPKTANQAEKDIADIVELNKSVAGHAVIILYRFGRAK